ncbi:MAG TPA: hypothetical protein VHB21_25365 [Minicystis sp.]|nr:hypothetical protein [Minicystis sp.]
MMHRLVALLALVFVCLALPAPAYAGSYLDRAALMLDEARKEGDVLLPRTFDKELIVVLKAVTEARARAGSKMEVPAAVAKAHPHLLLVLANYERAVDFASEGNFKKFVEHLNTAREEEQTFRAVLKELGYTLPDFGKK